MSNDFEYSKYHRTILTHLFNHGYIAGRHTSKDSAVKKFPKSDRGNAKDAFEQLIKWNLILVKKTSSGEHIRLNQSMLHDIKRIIDPQNQSMLVEKSPVEDLVDSGYWKKAFYITETQRNIKGVRSKYSYHKQIANESCIMVYIYNEKGENIYKIFLGSFNDPESLLYKSIRRIDNRFKGRAFSRAEMNDLGRDIIGNKQQLKAIVDMLLFYNYLVQVEKSGYYLRTSKILPKVTIDEYRK